MRYRFQELGQWYRGHEQSSLENDFVVAYRDWNKSGGRLGFKAVGG